jgi:hypothetical protein
MNEGAISIHGAGNFGHATEALIEPDLRDCGRNGTTARCKPKAKSLQDQGAGCRAPSGMICRALASF